MRAEAAVPLGRAECHYDMIELTPRRAKAIGADRWQITTADRLEEALHRKVASIRSTADQLLPTRDLVVGMTTTG